MTTNILAVAKNSFRETMRDKILLSGLFAILAIILFTLFIGSISLGESTRVIINFSVTAIYCLQIFVAIFIGSMLMYKEIERKTFYLILPKPITRTEIIIGKCVGLTLTTFLVTFSSTLVLILILFLKGGTSYIAPVIISLLLSTLEVVLLILISILFSSITSPLLASISTVAMYFIGHGGAIFKAIFTSTTSPVIEIITQSAYYILPNLEKFNTRNDIVYLNMPSSISLLVIVLYGAAYTLLLLVIAQVVFKKKDF